MGMQKLRIGLILVLEGVVFHYIWLKYFFGKVPLQSNRVHNLRGTTPPQLKISIFCVLSQNSTP